MKKINFILLSLSLTLSCNLFGQGAPSSSTPSGSGGPNAGKPKGTGPSPVVRPPLGKPKEPEKKIEKQNEPGAAQKYTIRPVFTEPGTLNVTGQGVDHLYNIGSDIPVSVEIVKSDDSITAITRDKIQEMVEKVFNGEGINTNVKPSTGPALPFFHVLVMIIPAGDGFSAFCAGRIFENVTLSRVNLPVGLYFQAITWEYQNLIYASKEDSEKQIESAIADIVQQFLSRYKYYKTIAP